MDKVKPGEGGFLKLNSFPSVLDNNKNAPQILESSSLVHHPVTRNVAWQQQMVVRPSPMDKVKPGEGGFLTLNSFPSTHDNNNAVNAPKILGLSSLVHNPVTRNIDRQRPMAVLSSQPPSPRPIIPRIRAGYTPDTGMRLPQLHWTKELHHRFLHAVEALGGEIMRLAPKRVKSATPKFISPIMNAKGLTLNHIRSHLSGATGR
ncbi:hypothetical protein OROMI_027918 [Orobanche minor]